VTDRTVGSKAPFSTFRLETQLPSLKVDFRLLEALETYLRRRNLNLAEQPPSQDDDHFFITVSDSLGEQTVSSTADLSGQRFLDSTREVTLNLRSPRPRSQDNVRLVVTIRFSNEAAWKNRITVEAAGPAAREVAAGVHQSVMEILSQARTHNSIFHPPEGIDGLLAFVAGGAIMAAFWFRERLPLWAVVAVVVTGVVWLSTILKRSHPYSLFDSNRSERVQRFSAWLLYGLLGFLLFQVVLVQFWERFSSI
jgi:hypothetical protein